MIMQEIIFLLLQSANFPGKVEPSKEFFFLTNSRAFLAAFVNNINTIEGGTHLEGFKRAVTKAFNDYARNHGILKEKDVHWDFPLKN